MLDQEYHPVQASGWILLTDPLSALGLRLRIQGEIASPCPHECREVPGCTPAVGVQVMIQQIAFKARQITSLGQLRQVRNLFWGSPVHEIGDHAHGIQHADLNAQPFFQCCTGKELRHIQIIDVTKTAIYAIQLSLHYFAYALVKKRARSNARFHEVSIKGDVIMVA
ncbi:hypothetical protein D3C72_1877150 [compost metagenome]